jgi:hypothetical protein
MKLTATITLDWTKKPLSVRIAEGGRIDIAGGGRIIGKGADRRESRETANVVNSRTCDRFSPHNGDFFEGYRSLRFGPRHPPRKPRK